VVKLCYPISRTQGGKYEDGEDDRSETGAEGDENSPDRRDRGGDVTPHRDHLSVVRKVAGSRRQTEG